MQPDGSLQVPRPDHPWRSLYCEHCGHTIKAIMDCGDRFCPHCAHRRARRIQNRLAFLLEKTPKVPKAGIKMLTLSYANCKDLDLGIKHLVSSFRRLRQRSLWKHYVLGGAFVIEIKGRPGNWHPHIHAIIHAYYIPWPRLRSAWVEVSRGTAVWINAVSNDRAINYLTKYVTKTDLPAGLHGDVSDSLRRYRLFLRFGTWHNIILPKLIYDTPCDRCGHTDWMVDLKFHRLFDQRGSPGYTKKPTPVLSQDDIDWRSPPIWPSRR